LQIIEFFTGIRRRYTTEKVRRQYMARGDLPAAMVHTCSGRTNVRLQYLSTRFGLLADTLDNFLPVKHGYMAVGVETERRLAAFADAGLLFIVQARLGNYYFTFGGEKFDKEFAHFRGRVSAFETAITPFVADPDARKRYICRAVAGKSLNSGFIRNCEIAALIYTLAKLSDKPKAKLPDKPEARQHFIGFLSGEITGQKVITRFVELAAQKKRLAPIIEHCRTFDPDRAALLFLNQNSSLSFARILTGPPVAEMIAQMAGLQEVAIETSAGRIFPFRAFEARARNCVGVKPKTLLEKAERMAERFVVTQALFDYQPAQLGLGISISAISAHSAAMAYLKTARGLIIDGQFELAVQHARHAYELCAGTEQNTITRIVAGFYQAFTGYLAYFQSGDLATKRHALYAAYSACITSDSVPGNPLFETRACAPLIPLIKKEMTEAFLLECALAGGSYPEALVAFKAAYRTDQLVADPAAAARQALVKLKQKGLLASVAETLRPLLPEELFQNFILLFFARVRIYQNDLVAAQLEQAGEALAQQLAEQGINILDHTNYRVASLNVMTVVTNALLFHQAGLSPHPLAFTASNVKTAESIAQSQVESDILDLPRPVAVPVASPPAISAPLPDTPHPGRPRSDKPIPDTPIPDAPNQPVSPPITEPLAEPPMPTTSSPPSSNPPASHPVPTRPARNNLPDKTKMLEALGQLKARVTSESAGFFLEDIGVALRHCPRGDAAALRLFFVIIQYLEQRDFKSAKTLWDEQW